MVVQRRGRSLAAIASLAALALLVGGAATSAAAQAQPEGGSVGAGNSVAIPYEGEIQVTPAEGWGFDDCAAVLAATPLATGCTVEQLVFAAPEYDPAAGVVRVPVAQSNGTVSLAVDYLVTLEPPEAPSFAESSYGYPVPAGGRVLVPLSDLGVVCTDCDETGGPRVRAGTVSPGEAGELEVTSTHLVLAAAAGYTGDVELSVQVGDDAGQWSPATVLQLRLVTSTAERAGALHVLAPMTDGGVTELDLTEYIDAEEPRIIGCGAAAAGSVSCSPGGLATVSGSAGDVDQFSFHIVDANGDQSTGSVTLIRPGSSAAPELDALLPAGAIGGDEIAAIVPATIPTDETAEEGTGVLTPFLRLLDRLGA